MSTTKKMIKTHLDDLAGPNRFGHIILWATLLTVIIFFIWAYYATLDQVTHAEGKVIPSSRIQIIQNLEGGIVKKITVQEGQKVEKNQVLMLLDDVRFSSGYNENKTKLMTLQLRIERLEAQIANKPFKPSTELKSLYPQLVSSQQELYHSRLNELAMMQNNLDLLNKEINMSKPFIKTGAVSVVEVLRLEQQVSAIKGKISSAKSTALDELNKAKAEYEEYKEAQTALQDRVDRTTIRSPVDGIIKQIYVNTIGGVIKPGMDVMEIVPIDDTLLIEAKVLPNHIGFLHVGQSANVKISAFDYIIYGGMKGKVEHIGADTVTDANDKHQKHYYEIWVRTQKNYLGTEQKKLQIIPGMTATVDILTDKHSVLDYLLKPINRARENALTER